METHHDAELIAELRRRIGIANDEANDDQLMNAVKGSLTLEGAVLTLAFRRLGHEIMEAVRPAASKVLGMLKR